MANSAGTRPRVFVSSVVDGFEEYRQAAREGIEAAGGDPILVNEDFPSLATSSRNACLDAVETSDLYIAVVGSRGGWETPSGRLVVEEEYEHAQRHNIPTIVFIQDTDRDPDAQRLVRQLSDYVDGRFRVRLGTPGELRIAVESALRGPIQNQRIPAVNPSRVTEHLQQPHRIAGQAALHFILVPERAGEAIHPVEFESDDFRHDLYDTAVARDVRLMSHDAAKRYELHRDSAVVHQGGGHGRDATAPEVKLEVDASGRVAIDAAVTGRHPPNSPFGGFEGMMIGRKDVEEVLRAAFAFSVAFYDRIDRFRRHERFLYGVALSGLQHKKWVEEVRPTNQISMSMRQHPEPLLLLPEPRVVSRDGLRRPEPEVERIITYARRELEREF